MNTNDGLRFMVYGAALALAAASSFATAAQGDSCAIRSAGAASASSATLGHLDAGGKCVIKPAAKEAKEAPKDKGDDGLAASAQCRDLSYSYNKRRDSACAKHGGVLEWLAQQ